MINSLIQTSLQLRKAFIYEKCMDIYIYRYIALKFRSFKVDLENVGTKVQNSGVSVEIISGDRSW